MSQDILADALNQIMNAKKAGKDKVSVSRHSKLLVNVLAIGKLKGYIKSYSIDGNNLDIEFGNLNFCKAVKPRFIVKVNTIEKYMRRYLPARNMGIIIISSGLQQM